MTEQEIRDHVIATAQKFIGCNERDGSHRQIIDIYNRTTPRPRGYAVQYSDNWCDTFVTAVADIAGVSSVTGRECGCEEHVKVFRKLGIWHEDGREVPQRGWIIVYNWDGKAQPNDGYSDHIGYVVDYNAATGIIRVIEGNKADAVGYRNVPIGAGYIRGYAAPNYASLATTAKQYYAQYGCWQKDAAGWWYPYGPNQGEYHVNNAVRIDGKLYFFDTEGYCVVNPEVETDDKGALRYIRGKRVQ